VVVVPPVGKDGDAIDDDTDDEDDDADAAATTVFLLDDDEEEKVVDEPMEVEDEVENAKPDLGVTCKAIKTIQA
jgi:hypothetical protein